MEMKVCEEHAKHIKRGMTYQIVEPKDCKLCEVAEQAIKQYMEWWEKHYW